MAQFALNPPPVWEVRAVMEELLADGLERGLIEDATIADSLEQGKMFWRIRELFGEVQRHEGGSIKHDISVPVAAVPAFINEASAAVIKPPTSSNASEPTMNAATPQPCALLFAGT